jgi:thioredoxin 1
MKKILFAFIFVALGTLACNSSDGKKAAETTSSTVKSTTPIVNNNEPIHLTKQMFLDQVMDYETNQKEWVYKGELPGIVDFYADWCRPCKITSPILDELAQEYAGKIQIYKVNIDEEKELASVFGVQSIPTFLFMPAKGNPTMSAGIAQTPDETKAMFIKQIEEILLK